MGRRITSFLVLSAVCACIQWLACGPSSTPDMSHDLNEAQRISSASSPSEQLLKELTKGQPTLTPAQNEQNARRLPQVMADSNAAMAKIQSGQDPMKALGDFQAKDHL